MAGGKPGLLARLFHRRKREDVEPTMPSVLGWAARRFLARSSGSDRGVGVTPIDLDTFLSAARDAVPAYLAGFHGDRDLPDLLVFVPDRSAAALGGAAGKGIPAMVGELASALAGVIARNPPEMPPLHRLVTRCLGEDLDELAWRASGTTAFRLEVDLGPQAPGPAVLHACVAEPVAARMSDALQSDSGFFGAVRTRIIGDASPAGLGLPTRSLRIQAGREFLLGNLLCPARAQCGRHVLETTPVALGAAPDCAALAASTGVWVTGSAEAAGARIPAVYFFATADAAEAARTRGSLGGVASCLFTAGLQALGSALGARPTKPSMSLAPRIPLPEKAAVVQVSARVKVASRIIPVEAFLDHATLTLLLRRLVEAPVLAAAAREPVPIVPLCLLASRALFHRQLPTLARSLAGTPEADLLPFGVFADLVTDRDLAVVLQNNVLAGLRGRSLRSLYSWSEPGSDALGQTLPRLVTPYFFDEERVLAALPGPAREEWNRGAAAVEVTREEHRELEREIMSGIDRGLRRGTLLLSPRARLLLDTTVAPVLRARAEAALARLASSREPFATIQGMSHQQCQQLLARCPTRSICLSLFGAEGEIAFVGRHVSATRLRRIHEDLAVLRRQQQAGALDVEEIMAGKQELQGQARKMLDELAREAGARGAREAGARGAREAGARGAREAGVNRPPPRPRQPPPSHPVRRPPARTGR